VKDPLPLADVIARIMTFLDPLPDRYEVSPTIFAKRPWTGTSETLVLRDEVLNGAAETRPDYPYMLEIPIALEVLTVWSEWRSGAVPTTAQAVEAVIFYATNDSYLPID
jgi:hypothetical protein